MKKLAILLILLMIVSAGFLSGCNEDKGTFQSDEEKLIGTWTYSINNNGTTINTSYVFLSNKKLEILFSYYINSSAIGDSIRSNGTWNITDNKLIMILENETVISNYSFSNNDKTLTITESSGNTSVFTKK